MNYFLPYLQGLMLGLKYLNELYPSYEAEDLFSKK